VITRYNLNDFTRGWLVGMFDNGILYRENIEVAVQQHNKGHEEPCHYHKESDEINIVVYGSCQLDEYSLTTNIKNSEEIFYKDDIFVVPRKTPVKFKALTNCKIVVIKTASIPTDKHKI